MNPNELAACMRESTCCRLLPMLTLRACWHLETLPTASMPTVCAMLPMLAFVGLLAFRNSTYS
jgi:hypothetical protein